MAETIFNEINCCTDPAELFDLTSEYFQGQGFGGLVYVAPSAATGPYVLMERGMPADWIKRYRDQQLHLHDPIPGVAFRLGHPTRLDDLLKRMPALNHEERCFMEAFKTSGISNGLIIPTYGPFGRPGMVGLGEPAHPQLLDQFNSPLAAAVAQAFHTRMELMQITEPPPGLSPREREILSWLGRGKSTGDIATILGLKAPTVTTHIQRLYNKLQVHDRASCVAKAMAHHYV